MESRHLIQTAIAVSLVGHLALAVGVYFADARPFDPSVVENIAVDIVTPEDMAAVEKPPEPKAPEPAEPPKPEFRLPDLNKPTSESKPPSTAAKSPQPQPAQQPPSPPAQQQSAVPPAAQSAPQQTPAPALAPGSPPPQQQAALQPEPPQSPTAAPSAEPDITVKYGVMLGLPDGNGGSAALGKADIAPLDIAAFRRHLKSCSKLPAAVTANDKVRIVLRAFLAPDGRLITEPSLIEASASAKGPMLMQAAMRALQACQPYAMLPADKYNEWKVLDLAFTPQDFAG